MKSKKEILCEVAKAIKGKFINGASGQVGVSIKILKGWMPAPGKVNIGISESMTIEQREKHVLMRINAALDEYQNKISIFFIKYGTGTNFYFNEIKIATSKGEK